MKGHLRSKYQHSTLLEMSYFIMTIIIHWLLFSHFIILCNEFKMFITLGFYDSKYGLYIYIKDWRNAKYTMHNYFTACIYIVKVNIKWPRLPFQLGTRGWSTVWCLLDVEEKQSQNDPNGFEIWFFIRLQLYISSFTFFTIENFRYGTVVQYERMTVDMWWRNLILLVIAETI